MFSVQHGVSGGVGISDPDGYDFSKSENAARWKGLFTPSLKKVCTIYSYLIDECFHMILQI